MSDAPEPHWLTDDQQKVWRAYLLGSARLTQALDADLRRSDLDLPEYEILVTLSEAPERQLRMSELADAVHQSRSRLTHTVSRMEKAKLVERVGCPTDRRGVWATLTETGMDTLRTAAPSHVEAVRSYFVDVVDADDYAALGRAFRAVIETTEPD